MVNVIYSAAVLGMEGIIIAVEASAGGGPLSRLDVIGLPDAAVKEAASRVRAAAKQNAIRLRRGVMTVNLAPADLRKEGTLYDLPMLLSLLDPDEQRDIDFSKRVFVGELSLTGELRAIDGALPMALSARDAGFTEIYLPDQNAAEASAASGIRVYPVKNLKQLFLHLTNKIPIEPKAFDRDAFFAAAGDFLPDFSDVKGQDGVKTALEIAAAGNHNLLLIGSPGSGKSMLASRLPGILPPLTLEESIETSKIYSIAGLTDELTPLLTSRPFRAPHHTLSPAALTGGGSIPKPGEISLANNGVLFLDEFPELDKRSREGLRQPVESHSVVISRVGGTVTFPANFLLVCAMNPCKCGYFGHPTHPCTCGASGRFGYLRRVSGPILDRIDIQVAVDSVSFSDLDGNEKTPSTAEMRARVLAARNFALARFAGETTLSGKPLTNNAAMEPSQMKKFCVTTPGARALLEKAFDSLSLSARGYDKLLKVARTVADFDRSELIEDVHMMVAVRLRTLDRIYAD